MNSIGANAQYCSLNDLDALGKIDPFCGLPLAWAQVVVAHLPLNAARIDPFATGAGALLKDFIEDQIMKEFPVPRGE